MEGTEVRLAREIFELEKKLADLARLEKMYRGALAAREQDLQEYLVQEGKSSTGVIEGIGTFSLRRENFVSVSQERMPTFLDFVRESGDGAMIVETIPVQTLKKYARDKLEAMIENFVDDPSYAAQCAASICAEEDTPPAELAKKLLEVRGVHVFQQIKLSHKKAK